MEMVLNQSKIFPGLKITRYTLLTAGLVIFPALLTLFNPQSFMNGGQWGRTILFGGVMICCLTYYAVRGTINAHDLTINYTDANGFLAILYVFLNGYALPNFYYSARVIDLLSLVIVYLILRKCRNVDFYFLFVGISLSGATQALFGNLQLLGVFNSNHGLYNLTGSFDNPGPFAGYLTSCLAASFFLFINRRQVTQNFNKIFRSDLTYFLVVLVPISALFSIISILGATQSRAAWIAGLVVVFLVSFPKLLKWLKSFPRAITRLIILVGLIAIGLSALSLYFMKENSANGRQLIWKVTTDIISHHPLFGVGHDQFQRVYMNYQGMFFQTHPNDSWSMLADNNRYAFNETLQLLAENGIVGLFLIGATYATAIFGAQKSPIVTFSKIGLAGVFVFGCFSYPSAILPIKLNAIIFLACLSASNPSKLILIHPNAVRGTLTFVVVAIFFYSQSIFSNTKSIIKAEQAWKLSDSMYSIGGYEQSIDYMKEANSSLKYNGDFLLQYGKALMLADQNQKALRVLHAAKYLSNNSLVEIGLGQTYSNLGDIKRAEASYISASQMVPGQIYPKYLLAKMYLLDHRPAEACRMARKILSMKIKVKSSATNDIRREMVKIIEENQC